MVSLNCKSDLVTVNGNLNARSYRDEILAEQVEPPFDDHALADRPIFMHDGATPHTARISMAFLRQSAMEVLPWPSLSPDLNPIEHVWDYIRRHLNEMDPRICTIIGRAARSDPWLRCGVICHSSISDVWFTVCGGEWQQLLRQMVAPHMQINKLMAEDSYCSHRFSVHFLLDNLRNSASCTKSGNFWTLSLGTLENNHNTSGLSISFQFCRKLTKHLLYHIANFDGGTQCVILGVICIFMKSTSCSSGCAPSPWSWSVLHTAGGFSVSSKYTIHRSLRHLRCLGNVRYCSPRCFHPNNLPSLADGTFPHDKVKLTGHKKLTFGVAKVVLVSTLLFKDYMVNFTNFCQTCYHVYTHHIDNFSGSHSKSNTMKNKFGKILQELFSRGVFVWRVVRCEHCTCYLS